MTVCTIAAHDLVLLAMLGALVGAYGSLVGAGGGFVLVPILFLLNPHEQPATITSISLAVVFANALSATVAYARQRRIDYHAAITFALATVPGAIAGASVIAYIPRQPFALGFGVLLIGLSLFVFKRGERPSALALAEPLAEGRWFIFRRIIDRTKREYQYTYHQPVGILVSGVIGFVASLLGIGGGIMQVPAMTQLMRFPAHVATATSTFVLMVMAFAGTAVHVANGRLNAVWPETIALALGVMVGAQLGARLSQRLRGAVILRALAVGLLFVGFRLVLSGFGI